MPHPIDKLVALRADVAELDRQLRPVDQPLLPITEELVPCEQCGGTGVDPGSLTQPEECRFCGGYGDVLPPEEVQRIADVYRKPMKREESLTIERKWRVGE